MSAGWCQWHQGHADDVEIIDVIERGSGPPAAASACLPCARNIRGIPYGEVARAAVKALEARGAASRGGTRA
ncbi:hypothetical protein FM076_22930 [Streptomyces albus subsp. chlorinus]|uniref:hypothetical protein n=1 Tax=Streptomyces albus TaxID=1888 RepID=UPI00156DFB38|nr:hypothetical protein [Streptomyces albus]NSC23854.1 hypothetical protein [Streptomyces albus subsp. chlorinus]